MVYLNGRSFDGSTWSQHPSRTWGCDYAGGERLAEFTLTMPVTPPSGWYLRFAEKNTLVWFGSKTGSGSYSS